MRKLNFNWLFSLLFLTLSLTLTGCDFVGDVLEFGFWTALILIAVVVAIGYFILRMFRK
ncbi:hypothetical protein POKO110462_13070 [Pontibacter korlensis]|uniref:hypothetical protein n=1 Tax=Pontibacter korlensis TaxID=400092 RepID=UPI000AFBDF7D|nr:hypothetical protein [Pontibacter korlensis]